MKENVKLDKKKDDTPVIVHSLSHDGRGIATINNKTTFIPETLPGEEILCTITQKRTSYQEAKALKILNSAPERIKPPCQHFGVCGGCNLQHMNTEMQLQLKQQTLLNQLKHFGNVSPQFLLSPLHANFLGYRRKARLGVKFVIKKNKLLVGFREKSSRYLADLERCVILHPKVGEHLHELSQLITSLEAYCHIPQIEIAMGDEDTALIFRHLLPLSKQDEEQLISFARQHHFHIYLQPNAPAVVTKLWPEDSLFRLRYTLPDHALEFLFHPLDFTQINLEMNRLMIKQALHLLTLQKEDVVLDLFCGIGNFTLPIAKQVQYVTGIEGGIEMVTRAKENALHNKITNVDFHLANLFAPQADAEWLKRHYDKILLDPPRAGAKEILPHITQVGAKKIVYVSCNPATLARDAGELVHQYGYQLTQAGIMNMFPHTAHIEAIALFEKI